MKVIKQGEKPKKYIYQVECPKIRKLFDEHGCGSIIQFTRNEVKVDFGYLFYIICPVCGEKIYVDDAKAVGTID